MGFYLVSLFLILIFEIMSNNKITTSTVHSKVFAQELAKLLAPIPQTLKLILHAGTPKTGTTSLQIYLAKKQYKLQQKGMLYPSRSHNVDAPKHQWFEKNLVRTHPQNLLENFKEILKDVDENTHTILLSSEGIYNRWWDFPEESKALLFEINKLFEMKLWVWFREPLAFAESFYKQCMRNPMVKQISCYGKDLSFADILEDPWFSQQLNYIGFVNECDELFGKDSVIVFEYQQDTVKTVSQLLGLATPHEHSNPRKNRSMNTVTTALFRVVNRLQLSAKEKEKLVPYLHGLDTTLNPYVGRKNKSLIDDVSRDKIIQMTTEGMKEIHKRFK